MKEPLEWVESDLLELIRDKVSESTVLDYKAPESLRKNDPNKKEISKDVSAFANSAGGTIVYGIDERGHLPVAVRGVDPAMTSREWIEQIINSSIQRRIDGIRINQVLLTTIAPRDVAYVVNIPQSTRAPHMASDNKFYKRFNFQSVPMEEYEVRDVARRSEAPDLWLEFDLASDPNSATLRFKERADFSEPVELLALIVNRAPALAVYGVIALRIDSRLRAANTGSARLMGEESLDLPDGIIRVARYGLNWGPPARLPIWEGIRFNINETPLSVMLPREPGYYYISWDIHSPGMSTHSGIITLVSDGTQVVLR